MIMRHKQFPEENLYHILIDYPFTGDDSNERGSADQ